MKPDDVDLGSVNWEHGMLLTPEHFLRQERYIDSALLWILRYASDSYGLVGGGPRVLEAERGAVRHDPIFVMDEDAESLRLSVTQCRGLTPAGCIVDIDPGRPLHNRVPRTDLEGVVETLVYIVCDPHTKEAVDGGVDQFNPQMKTERRAAYRLSLRVTADEMPYAVVVARVRRQRFGAGFERDAAFIPPCTSLVSHSELTASWRKIVDSISALAERYTELHRATREFIVLFTERGIETDIDIETMRFVDRMVSAVQDCLHGVLDPVQSPQRFFGHVRRYLQIAAVYIDLTPAVQQYFDTLKEAGETEFIAPLEQQKQLMNTSARWGASDDLGVDVRSSLQALSALHRLERALEGKYIDFRVSTALDTMNFVFDRGGKTLYRAVVGHSRVHGVGDELTIYFSQLRLEGRDKYRMILIGERDAIFEQGTRIPVDISINEGSGFRRQPVHLSHEVASREQRNFEFDFDAPDVQTITDLKVSVPSRFPVRTAMLFTRHRFYATRPQDAPRTIDPVRPVAEPANAGAPPPAPEPPSPRRDPFAEPPPRGRSRIEPQHPEPAPDPRIDREPAAPWQNPPPPPRRRRIE
jgi:hypothetical protein